MSVALVVYYNFPRFWLVLSGQKIKQMQFLKRNPRRGLGFLIRNCNFKNKLLISRASEKNFRSELKLSSLLFE